MRRRNLWVVWVGLTWALSTGGCQTAGGDGAAAGPMFGMNQVPQQSEPPLEDDGSSPQTAASDPVDIDAEEPEAETGKPGRGLLRLLAGRDKEPAPRKALPLTEQSASEADDDFDF